MINIANLKESDIGQMVIYRSPSGDKVERGKISSWNDEFIFVNYEGYSRRHPEFFNPTAAATNPEWLEWEEERRKDWRRSGQTWGLRVQELRDLVGTYYDPSQFDPDDFESRRAYRNRLRDEIVCDHPELSPHECFQVLEDVIWRVETEGADPRLLATIAEESGEII